MNRDFKMVATTMFGFEELLATELKNLGAQDVEPAVRSVSFRGDKGFMYKANIALRTAIRILKPIKIYDPKKLSKICSQFLINEYGLKIIDSNLDYNDIVKIDL